MEEEVLTKESNSTKASDTAPGYQSPDFVSAANLAYLGDCVYELCVREYLVKHLSAKPSVESLAYVTAKVQNAAYLRIQPLLTDAEAAQFRRGKNIGHSSIPKSASPTEYSRATGLEALFGWLYLKGETERIAELFEAAFTEE